MLGNALKPIHCGFVHLEGRADLTQGPCSIDRSDHPGGTGQ